MATPKRIQLRRTKGWRKPEGTIVVSRPSRWGNPFRVGDMIGPVHDCEQIRSRAQAVFLFANERRRGLRGYPPVDVIRANLAGHDLACWCPLDQPCHADILLELANGATP